MALLESCPNVKLVVQIAKLLRNLCGIDLIYVKNVGTIRGASPKVVITSYKKLASQLLFDITFYTLLKGMKLLHIRIAER